MRRQLECDQVESQGTKTVRGVARALDILDRFLDQSEPLGAAEVARLTGMPRSTTYRLLITLEERGYLERHAGGERFQLGARLTRRRPDGPAGAIVAVAQPVMEGLRDTCGETVGLHLLVGDERVCVAACEGNRPLRASGLMGSRAPLYSGASARVIMAYLEPERQDRIISSTGLVPLTRRTITDPDLLRAELVEIRRDGFAVSTGEWDEGLASVSAPLFDRTGIVGCITVTTPVARFRAETVHLLTAIVKTASEEITRRLQGEPTAIVKGGYQMNGGIT